MGLFSFATNQPTFPEMYEKHLVATLFRPFAEIALNEINLSPGDRVLDIACGTGIVARVARERMRGSAHVVGVDANQDMLNVARSVAPGIDWREGNAAALPLREGEVFDVITCQQGLQFFPDKPAAVAQMRSASAPGGRVALETWRSDNESPFFLELRRIAEDHLGEIKDSRFGFGDSAALEKLLNEAGFLNVRSRVISRIAHFNADSWMIRGNAVALLGTSAAGKAMDEAEKHRVIDTIVVASQSVHDRYCDGAEIAFEVSTNLATARADG
jgi:ubiquinone/menaquinone biosynthesis C-methylase UbiE